MGNGIQFAECDVFCLAETWWSDSDAANFGRFEDTHEHYYVCRGDNEHGGLSVFVSKSIAHRVLFKGLDPETILVSLGREDALLCFAYIPPNGSVALSGDPFQALVARLTETRRHSVVFVVGDLNARVGNYDGVPLTVEVSAPWLGARPAIEGLPVRHTEDIVVEHNVNSWGRKLVDACNDLGLCILNGRTPGDPTGAFTFRNSRGNSVIDMALCSAAAWALRPDVRLEHTAHTQHSLLTLSFKCRVRSIVSQPRGRTPKVVSMVWDKETCELYSEEVMGQMERLDALVANQGAWLQDRGQRAAKQYRQILKSCMRRAQKKRQEKGLNLRDKILARSMWWDDECQAAREKAQFVYNEGREQRATREQVKRAKNEYRFVVKSKKVAALQKRDTLIIQAAKGDQKTFFSLERDEENGGQDVDPEAFCQHLQASCPPSVNESLTPTGSIVNTPGMAEELNVPFTPEEVAAALAKMAGQKAAADGLPAACLKFAAEVDEEGRKTLLLPEQLTGMLNAVFMGGAGVPDEWLTAYVTPLYKGKGDRSDLNNYRRLTVSGTMYKLYATVMNMRLDSHLESNSLRSPYQCGFRRRMGTITAIWVLVHVINKTCGPVSRGALGSPLHVCFIDIKQAFDMVDRDKLWQRLLQLGVGGRFLWSLQDLYRSTTYKVRVGKAVSTSQFTTQLGVKQGCPLSPTLFGVFFEQLCDHLEVGGPLGCMLSPPRYLSSLLYADDSTLLSLSKPNLQLLCDRALEFCQQNGLDINVAKTVTCSFLPRTDRRRQLDTTDQAVLVMNGEAVQVQSSFRYLGALLDAKHNIKLCAENMAGAARKAVGRVKKFIKKLGIMCIDTKLRLFDILALSVGLYASQVWGVYYLGFSTMQQVFDNPLQKVMKQFLQELTGCPDTVSRWALLENFGFRPVQARYLVFCIRYWNLTCGGPLSSLSREAMAADVQLFKMGHKSCWSGKFLQAMSDLNLLGENTLPSVREMQPETIMAYRFPESVALEAVDRRYEELRVANVTDTRSTPSRGSVLTKLRTWMQGETMAHKSMQATPRLTTTLQRFRLGFADLNGNDHYATTEGRRCRLCTGGCEEDEKHFLLECPAYAGLRQHRNWAELFPEGAHMKGVMDNKNQCKLARYIFAAYKHRREWVGFDRPSPRLDDFCSSADEELS